MFCFAGHVPLWNSAASTATEFPTEIIKMNEEVSLSVAIYLAVQADNTMDYYENDNNQEPNKMAVCVTWKHKMKISDS